MLWKTQFLCNGLILPCLQFFCQQSLSLPLYKMFFQTKPFSGFVQNFISRKGFEQNGKFKMFWYKNMLCSFYDLRLTAIVFSRNITTLAGRFGKLHLYGWIPEIHIWLCTNFLFANLLGFKWFCFCFGFFNQQ